MAKMYPPTIPNSKREDASMSAEIEFYNQLAAQLGKSWTIFYSIPWLEKTHQNSNPRDGETDFIVVHPDYGVLLIEVKGGKISYDGSLQQWYSTDRYGNNHPIDPVNQVKKCKYSLIEKLKKLLPQSFPLTTHFAHAVSFPHSLVSKTIMPLDLPREIVIDLEDMKKLEAKIIKIFNYKFPNDKSSGTNNRDVIKALERILIPTISFPNPLSAKIKEEEQEIIRLTEEQYNILDLLGRTSRAAISGCAGSGKTMLAVEKAKRLAKEGKRTLLTCFNIPLAQYLHERTLDIENLDCYNFHGLCEKLALEISINLKKRIDRANKEERSKIYDEYPDVLSQTLLTKPELKYDAIIIDEGQDFKEEWWVALNYCQKDDTILYVFYDDNQQLYKGRGYIPEDLPVFPLTRNLRNAHRIHQTFSKYYKSNQKTVCEGPTGGKVEMVKYQNVSELAKQLGKVLYTLVEEERIDAREIAVLTPKGQTVLRDIELTNGFKLITVDDLPKNPKRDITWSTVYRFKGLERSVVIVVELDQDLLAKGVEWIQLCYVAFSRPRHCLILFATEELYSILSME